MKRKTSDVPTRIYSFRCLAPRTEQKRVEDQFYLAHQYRNALVEIELRLRGRIRDVQLDHPVVGPELVQYEGADASIEDTYADMRAAKSGTATPDLDRHRERLASEAELRAESSDVLRAVKLKYKDELVPGYEDARRKAHEEKLTARHDFIERGLRHGTYSRIEDAVKQAAESTYEPLRFERYTGEGSIGTQLIASSRAGDAKGLTVKELHSLTDTRLRLQPLPDNYDEMPRNRRRHAARVCAWLRIGTVSDGRAPIFAEFPVTFHRPLPKDAVIKWAYVVRTRVGYRFEWRLQLTIESETFRTPAQASGEGACAIDFGWRRIFDDDQNQIALRAGVIVDDQGREREIFVPEKLWRGMGKVTDLAAIRSKNLDRMRDALAPWFAERARTGTLPAWIVERTRGFAQWRAPRKLQALADTWMREENRFPDDETRLEQLREWAKQDRHLVNWEEFTRDRLLTHRRECWRVLAAELANTYKTIVIEDGTSRLEESEVGMMRLTSLPGWEQPSPEEGDPSDGREQRRMSRLAAIGELRGEIVKAVAKTGARIDAQKTHNSTRECAWCAHVQTSFDARASITCTCEGCGRIWDQDFNAGRNLLHRAGFASGPTAPSTPPMPASPMSSESGRIYRSSETTLGESVGMG
jgi:ribosomal protein S27E